MLISKVLDQVLKQLLWLLPYLLVADIVTDVLQGQQFYLPFLVVLWCHYEISDYQHSRQELIGGRPTKEKIQNISFQVLLRKCCFVFDDTATVRGFQVKLLYRYLLEQPGTEAFSPLDFIARCLLTLVFRQGSCAACVACRSETCAILKHVSDWHCVPF